MSPRKKDKPVDSPGLAAPAPVAEPVGIVGEVSVDEIDAVVERFGFTAPIELDDVMVARAELLKVLPPDIGVEIFHRNTEVTVLVRAGDRVLYKRTKRIT